MQLFGRYIFCAASELNQMAWLLKTVAIELKVTATHMHHSQLGNLVNLLVREQGEEMVAVSVEENAPSDVTEVSTIMQLSHYLATPSSEYIIRFMLHINNAFNCEHCKRSKE
jgi:hypothetical protein